MIDWEKLRHAGGPATRVPQQIAALGSSELPARDEATKALGEALVRDGETFSAAAPALDELIVLFGSRAAGAHRAAWIIGEIFAADHLSALAGRAPVASPERALVLERAAAARAALQSALSSDDASFRAAATFALAFVPDVDVEHLAAASKRAVEGDADVGARASSLWAIGFRARTDESALRGLPDASEDVLTRGLVAIALAISGREVADTDLASGWVRFWLTPLSQEVAPWGRLGGAFRFAEAVVADTTRRESLAPGIAEALVASPRTAFDARRPVIAKLVLDWSGITARYPDKRIADVDALTPTERRIAEAFANDTSLGVAEAGLPGDARAIRRWLGRVPPGPLEAHGPSGRPRWIEARERVERGDPFEEVLAALTEGVSAVDRLSLLTELLRGAYRIVSDGYGYVPPEALAEAAADAGPEAVDWATAIVHEVNALPAGILDYGALQAFVDDHLMVAFRILIDAKHPLEKGAERLVSLTHPEARAILAAFPAEAVRTRVLADWRALPIENAGARGSFIGDLVPLFDLVGSRDLARELLVALEDPMIKARGFAPAFLAMLSDLATG